MEENKALIEKWVKQLMKKYDLYYLESFFLVKADTASYDPRTKLTYRLTYNELQQQTDDENWTDSGATMLDLARGMFNVVKIPFIPKYQQTYYYIEWCGPKAEPYVTETVWDDAAIDFYNLSAGNCFKSVQTAEAKKHKIYKHIKEMANKS